MALRKAPLLVTFTGGLDTKTDEKNVATTKLLDLQNAIFTKETTLSKRNGYRALGNTIDGQGTTYPQPVGMGVRDDELLIFTGQRCLSYRDSVDRWSDAGEVASVVASDRAIARTGTNQTMPDHASNGGITVAAWEDNRGGVWASVLEQSSGRILVPAAQVDATGISPRCYAAGTVVHLLWASPTTGRILSLVVTPAAPALGVAQMVTDDLLTTNPVFDACAAGNVAASVTGDSNPGLLAWATAVGHRVAYVAPSGLLGSPVSGYPSAGNYTAVSDTVTSGIAVTLDKTTSASIAVTWSSPDAFIRVAFIAPALLSSAVSWQAGLGTAWTRVAAEFDATGTVWWIAETQTAGRDDLSVVSSGGITAAGMTISAPRALRGHGLMSRAFLDGVDVYALVGHGVQFYPYVACVRLSSAAFGAHATTTVARLLPGLSSGLPTRVHVTSVQALAPSSAGLSRQHMATLGYRIQLSSANSDQFGEQGIRLNELDFDHAEAYQSAQLGRSLYLAGAVPQSYDGNGWAEADFHAAPDTVVGVTLVAAGTGGALTPSVTYEYKIMYEFEDAAGELHPGAVGVALNVALGAGQNAATLTLPTYRLTTRAGHIRISVWRAPGNQTGLPSSLPFYRVTSTDPSATGPNGYVTNDPTVDSIAFVDNIADTALIDLEPLYTNGGILSNDPPAWAGGCIAGGKTRLFWTDPSDGNLVRYSQQLEDDTAVEMSAALSLRVDPYGGAIMALGVMDDGVFAFKESAIYVFDGPGPDADGGEATQDAFTPATLLTSDVGCSAPGSICQTPNGIVFQSAKGMRLLGRDRQIQNIGDPVYAYNAQTIVRATLIPDRPQIVFLTDAGSTLLWDYERNQWSRYMNHEGLDAAIVDGTYNYLRTDGRVFVETPGLYKDDNSPIPMRIDTAFIKAAGYLQGWQKIWTATFLGAWKSSHTMNVRYRIDYEDGWSAAIPIAVDDQYDPSLYGAGFYGAGLYGGPGGPSTVYQESIHLNLRCQSIAFRFEDSEPGGSFGASFELSELLLEGGILRPRFAVGAARQN